MTDENFKIKLNKELESLGNERVVLLNSDSKYYFDSLIETLKFMTGKGMGGVYITVVRPYTYLIKRLEKQGVDTKNLFFIDAISCMAGKSPGEQENCVFIETPNSLENIRGWVEKSMRKLDMENKFLIFDSVSTMLIYNDVDALEEFSQFLVDYLHFQKTTGILASSGMDIPGSLLKKLNDMSEKIIKI